MTATSRNASHHKAHSFLDNPSTTETAGAFHLVMPDGTNVVWFCGEVAHVFTKGERLGPMQLPAHKDVLVQPSLPSIWDHGSSAVGGGAKWTLADAAVLRRKGMQSRALEAKLQAIHRSRT